MPTRDLPDSPLPLQFAQKPLLVQGHKAAFAIRGFIESLDPPQQGRLQNCQMGSHKEKILRVPLPQLLLSLQRRQSHISFQDSEACLQKQSTTEREKVQV